MRTPHNSTSLSKSLLANSKQLEITARLRVREIASVSRPNLGLISARMPLGDSDLGVGCNNNG